MTCRLLNTPRWVIGRSRLLHLFIHSSSAVKYPLQGYTRLNNSPSSHHALGCLNSEYYTPSEGCGSSVVWAVFLYEAAGSSSGCQKSCVNNYLIFYVSWNDPRSKERLKQLPQLYKYYIVIIIFTSTFDHFFYKHVEMLQGT